MRIVISCSPTRVCSALSFHTSCSRTSIKLLILSFTALKSGLAGWFLLQFVLCSLDSFVSNEPPLESANAITHKHAFSQTRILQMSVHKNRSNYNSARTHTHTHTHTICHQIWPWKTHRPTSSFSLPVICLSLFLVHGQLTVTDCKSDRGKTEMREGGSKEEGRKGGSVSLPFLWRQLKCSQTQCINQDFMDSFAWGAADETEEEENK